MAIPNIPMSSEDYERLAEPLIRELRNRIQELEIELEVERIGNRFSVITDGKGGVYRWGYETLPEGDDWAWIQRKPIDKKYFDIPCWHLSPPAE